MYLTINGNRHTISRRIVEADTIKYLTVTPEPEEISGTIQMFRDDGLLMSEDNADDFERRFYVGTLLTLTNQPEPVPAPIPEPEPDVWDELAAAIQEGVNDV